MEKKDWTMMKLKKQEHSKMKMYSALRGMTMMDYLAYLISLDEDIINEEQNNLLKYAKVKNETD